MIIQVAQKSLYQRGNALKDKKNFLPQMHVTSE